MKQFIASSFYFSIFNTFSFLIEELSVEGIRIKFNALLLSDFI
jgi:hypothetical protein